MATSYQPNTYSPFVHLQNDRFQLVNSIIIQKNKKDDLCVNNYVLHRVIGRGSYAVVRQAYDTLNEEKVAIRIVNRVQLARKLGQEVCDAMIANHLKILSLMDPRFVLQLKQFIYTNLYTEHIALSEKPIPISHELANMFESLPQIKGVPIRVEEEDDDMSITTATPRSCIRDKAMQHSCMFVFELAQSTLEQELSNPLTTFEQLRAYLHQTIQCLDHMHELRIVYNDLKAENILIVDGKVKFSDFDTSVCLDDNKLQFCNLNQIFSDQQLINSHFIITDPIAYTDDFVGDIITTPQITSPEAQDKQNIFVGTASDIWQYGQLLCKTFLGKSLNIRVVRNSPDYNLLKQTVNEELADLVVGCTDVAAMRYTSKQILQHPFFTLASMQKFKLELQHQRQAKLMNGGRKMVRRASERSLRSFIPSGDAANMLLQRLEYSIWNTIAPILHFKAVQTSGKHNRQFKLINKLILEQMQQIHKHAKVYRAASAQQYRNNKPWELQDLALFIRACDVDRMFARLNAIVVDWIDMTLFRTMDVDTIKAGLESLTKVNFLLRYSRLMLGQQHEDVCKMEEQKVSYSNRQDSLKPVTTHGQMKQLTASLSANGRLTPQSQMPPVPRLSTQSNNRNQIFKDQPVCHTPTHLANSSVEPSSSSDYDLPCKYMPYRTMQISIPVRVSDSSSQIVQLRTSSSQQSNQLSQNQIGVPSLNYKIPSNATQIKMIADVNDSIMSSVPILPTIQNNTAVYNEMKLGFKMGPHVKPTESIAMLGYNKLTFFAKPKESNSYSSVVEAKSSLKISFENDPKMVTFTSNQRSEQEEHHLPPAHSVSDMPRLMLHAIVKSTVTQVEDIFQVTACDGPDSCQVDARLYEDIGECSSSW